MFKKSLKKKKKHSFVILLQNFALISIIVENAHSVVTRGVENICLTRQPVRYAANPPILCRSLR